LQGQRGQCRTDQARCTCTPKKGTFKIVKRNIRACVGRLPFALDERARGNSSSCSCLPFLRIKSSWTDSAASCLFRPINNGLRPQLPLDQSRGSLWGQRVVRSDVTLTHTHTHTDQDALPFAFVSYARAAESTLAHTDQWSFCTSSLSLAYSYTYRTVPPPL
jgi:hypothetical protein